jgi:hypothetical protein
MVVRGFLLGLRLRSESYNYGIQNVRSHLLFKCSVWILRAILQRIDIKQYDHKHSDFHLGLQSLDSKSGCPATGSSNSKLTGIPHMCTVQLNSAQYFHKGSESKVLWNTICRSVHILWNDIYSIQPPIYSIIFRRGNCKVFCYTSKFIMLANQLSVNTCNNT